MAEHTISRDHATAAGINLVEGLNVGIWQNSAQKSRNVKNTEKQKGLGPQDLNPRPGIFNAKLPFIASSGLSHIYLQKTP